MIGLIWNLINFLTNIRRMLFFPWSVLDYSWRDKPRYKYKRFFLKTTYYVLFYIKYIILTFLLWPYFIRRNKCEEDSQIFFNYVFRLVCGFWFIGIALAYAIMLLTKWFEVLIFFPFMRLIYFVLFESHYRKNKKLLFKISTKQELLDFKGDNMHKPEKSLLTYKESYQYGETYKKFTIPIYCSSPAIDLNYDVFKINQIHSYSEAKAKLIEILGDEFFEFLDTLNEYLEKTSQIYYDDKFYKDAITIVYTLIKRLDYNYIFLYFIPYLFGYISKEKNSVPLLEKANKLMRNYLEKDVYIIEPIFNQEKLLQIYQEYVIEKNDQVKKDFFNEIFYYQLLFSNLKKKYYFHSSDGKIEFTHPFLPIFFFRYGCIKDYEKSWLEQFPKLTGSIISNYNLIYPWLVICY